MSETLRDPVRTIELSGCFNFRDMGGYRTGDGRRVRWRRLFRADGLARLDEHDCARLAQLGICTVIDLRTSGELDDRGRLPEGDLVVEYHHLPLTDVLPPEQDLARYGEPEFVTDRYLALFSEGATSIARALEVLAAPGALPAVFHCSAGKDRTGVLAAIVLGFLGVADELIVEDYALSGEAMGRLLDWLRQEYVDTGDDVERYAPAVASAYPEAMAQFLSALRSSYGGFEELAATMGVAGAVEVLRGSLLEP